MAVELKNSATKVVANVVVVDATSPDEKLTIDRVVQELCNKYDQSRDLIRLVKFWATNSGLLAPKDGLPGIAWTLMVLCFLQTQGQLPSYTQLAEGQEYPPARNVKLSTLFSGFVRFLASRACPAGFSVANGIDQAPKFFRGALYIEDPGEMHTRQTEKNLCPHVGAEFWLKVIAKANELVQRCLSKQRWFHWATVFDPTPKPGKKVDSLQDAINQCQSSTSQQQGAAKAPAWQQPASGGKGQELTRPGLVPVGRR